MNLFRSAVERAACAALVFVLFTSLGATPLPAWEEERVKVVRELLEHDILPSDLPLHEVQAYTEARVAPMPKLTTGDAWRAEAERVRRQVLENVVFRGEAARWRDSPTRVEWLDAISGGEGYQIKKLRYEALPGLWIPALLYEPDNLTQMAPVVLNVNGHDGQGKAADYKQIRCINLVRRGMLALNVEWLGMGQLRGDGFAHYRMNQLDLCGASGLAPFYLAMERGLDVLLAHEHADPNRVAVAGLSGGGWQTIVISSLDPRVTLANPVAGYSSFRTRARNLSDLGDSEQTPTDLGSIADYTLLTALRAPRPTLLTYNAKDNCCFASDHALPPLLEAAAPVYRLLGHEERLRSHINHDPGTHNFERDNREAFYRALGDFFFSKEAVYTSHEIDSSGDLKTSEQLQVDLPADNLDFHRLATDLMKDLPQRETTPEASDAFAQWRQNRVEQLKDIVRAKSYEVSAAEVGRESRGELQAVYWRLRIGDVWTVPAVEVTAGEAMKTDLFVADLGRTSAAEAVANLLERKRRVLAIDPFYLGESKISQRDFLFALLVATIGDRPLGIQASQIAAIARWLHEDRHCGPCEITAHGRRTSLSALVAAAIENQAIDRVELHESLGSLKQVIEENAAVDQSPELFCFGLLEKFDVRDLATIVAPRTVTFPRAGDRVRKELSDYQSFLAQLGVSHDPFESVE